MRRSIGLNLIKPCNEHLLDVPLQPVNASAALMTQLEVRRGSVRTVSRANMFRLGRIWANCRQFWAEASDCACIPQPGGRRESETSSIDMLTKRVSGWTRAMKLDFYWKPIDHLCRITTRLLSNAYSPLDADCSEILRWPKVTARQSTPTLRKASRANWHWRNSQRTTTTGCYHTTS